MTGPFEPRDAHPPGPWPGGSGDASHVAVLDPTGKIVDVNAPWLAFAIANGFPDAGAAFGTNYLSVCDASALAGDPDAAEVAEGIRAVLAGTRGEYARVYACHSPSEERWFELRVLPHIMPRPEDGMSTRHVMLVHENITARRRREWDAASRYAADGERSTIPDMLSPAPTPSARTGPLVTLDHDGAVRYANGDAVRLLRVAREHLLGRELRDWWPRPVAPVLERACERAWQEGREIECRVMRDDAMIVEVRVRPSSEGIALYLARIEG